MIRVRIAFVVLIAAGSTLLGVAPVAGAHTQRCSISNNQEGTPGIDNLRATRTTCTTARGVGAALRRAARLGELERRPVVNGRRFVCTFRRRSSANGDYLGTVCQNASRTVTMRYYATGLGD